ncbi:hypothetical protein [Halospeciosus flavus]|uniref:Uncharacterized protein n=1 Tax=Halospeciosus flavus TaxID=3032283 RepID=A0ABD5Z527_9EURY|nr:hypothetical protein [Halospeciosus flavus]
MGVIDRFVRSGGEHTQPYECGDCEVTFKRRRFNCPACGGTTVRRR